MCALKNSTGGEISMTRARTILGIAAVTLLAFQTAHADGNTVYVASKAPFVDETMIAKNIIDECNLPASQIKLLKEHAGEAGFTVTENDSAVTEKKGKVLVVEIAHAISGGNAFIGHRKQVVLKGRLYENGAELGNFTATRSSMGGAFGGYKGSCSVLHRCQSTLAKDILTWMKTPGKDSRIGE
jgi:hypothetical protein